MTSGSAALSIERITQALTSERFGRPILLFNQVDSTNREAARRAESGLAEGGVVIAEAQTEGKGRMGRSWHSPPGVNLYLSLLLRPPRNLPSNWLPMLSAVSAVEAVETVCGFVPFIKWPNDLLATTPGGEKKIGGILLEMFTPQGPTPAGSSILCLIIGVGINVNLAQNAFPEEIGPASTSLCEIVHHEVDRNLLAAALLDRLEIWYRELLEGRIEEIRAAWTRHALTLGRRVRIVWPKGEVVGLAEGLGPDGTLLLRLPDGEPMEVTAADVIHLREAD